MIQSHLRWYQGKRSPVESRSTSGVTCAYSIAKRCKGSNLENASNRCSLKAPKRKTHVKSIEIM